MRALVVLGAIVVAAVACEEPQGEVFTCTQTWTCGDDVVANNSQNVLNADPGHVFCTRPGTDAFGGTAGADERSGDIAAYQASFADDCNGVSIGCEEAGEFATCAASCVVTDACPPADAVRVRHNL